MNNGFADETDVALETEEVEYEVMGEVETRLSMANYYKLFLNGTIFSDSETNPVAAAVEKEFQDYAKERLEILLGMKMPKQTSAPSPFTPDEIAALKNLAAKVISTAMAPRLTTQTPPPSPSLVKVEAPKAPALTPISAPKTPTLNTKVVGEKKQVAAPPPEEKPVVPTITVAKKKVGRPRGTTAPKKKPGHKPLPIPEGTPPEIVEKMKRAQARMAANPGGQVMPVSAKPLPRISQEQANMIEASRATTQIIETNTGNDSFATGY